MRRGPMSRRRQRRLSAGPGAGRLCLLSVRPVRLGRNGRVQLRRPTVRRKLGVHQDDGILYTCNNIIMMMNVICIGMNGMNRLCIGTR